MTRTNSQATGFLQPLGYSFQDRSDAKKHAILQVTRQEPLPTMRQRKQRSRRESAKLLEDINARAAEQRSQGDSNRTDEIQLNKLYAP